MNEVTCGLRHPKALHTGLMLETGGEDGLQGAGGGGLPGLLEQKGVWTLGRSLSSRLEKGYHGLLACGWKGAVRLEPSVPGKGPLGTVFLRAQSGDNSSVET